MQRRDFLRMIGLGSLVPVLCREDPVKAAAVKPEISFVRANEMNWYRPKVPLVLQKVGFNFDDWKGEDRVIEARLVRRSTGGVLAIYPGLHTWWSFAGWPETVPPLSFAAGDSADITIDGLRPGNVVDVELIYDTHVNHIRIVAHDCYYEGRAIVTRQREWIATTDIAAHLNSIEFDFTPSHAAVPVAEAERFRARRENFS